VRAAELSEPFPIVDLDTDVLSAARAIGAGRLPGLIVCDGDGRPHTILPGSQVLRFTIPAYVLDDPALARVYDDARSDRLMKDLARRTVRDVLPAPHDRDHLPVVDPDATVLEVAALMVRVHSPLVAVVDDGRVIGAITVSRLLETLLASDADES
jgi:hypothetical protein